MSERRITREEAIERVELHLRGTKVGGLGSQEAAEEIVEAIGAWEEEDKPPELPEGWTVGKSIDPVYRSTVRAPDGTLLWSLWTPERLRSRLARALAALRRDDGEVELMVPVSEIKHRGSEWDISPHQKMLMGQSAVRARRVRP